MSGDGGSAEPLASSARRFYFMSVDLAGRAMSSKSRWVQRVCAVCGACLRGAPCEHNNALAAFLRLHQVPGLHRILPPSPAGF